jgi:hypothetical protein
MSREPQDPDARTEPRAATEGPADPLTVMRAEERADAEEDGRRQRELDDGELGGEA